MRSLKILSLLALILLSSRGFAATYIVDNKTIDFDNGLPYTLGDGNTTLRKAINLANANLGKDTILFNLIAPKIIVLTLNLPQITDAIYIDGIKEVEIDNENHIGLRLVSTATTTSTGSEIKNLIIYDGQYENLIIEKGALITDLPVNNILIQGCIIGTDKSFVSTLNVGALASHGIRVANASNVIIGGMNPAQQNVIMYNKGSGVRAEVNSNDLQVINNVISGNKGNGLNITQSSNVKIKSNLIGLSIDGATAIGNSAQGIFLAFSSHNCIIGGSIAGEGNVISGNLSQGIYTENNITGLQIKGNLVGTDKTGLILIPNNQSNIDLNDTHGAIIGGITAAERNIVSGTTQFYFHGIILQGGPYSTNCIVKGNYIGTNINGKPFATQPAAGSNGYGVIAKGDGHVIGDTAAGAGNLIAGNAGWGVLLTDGKNSIVRGNLIGVDIDTLSFPNGVGTDGGGVVVRREANYPTIKDTIDYNLIAYNKGAGVGVSLGSNNNDAVEHTIRFNSIYCNTGKGIDLQLTAGIRRGNNNKQAPAIDQTLSTNTKVVGITNAGIANNKLDIYLMDSDPGCSDCAVNPQGKTYVTTITAAANGAWSFDFGAPIPGQLIATATDDQGNTSEFSLCYTPCYLNAKANAIPTNILLNNTNQVKVDLVSSGSFSESGSYTIAWFLTTPDGVTQLYAEKDTIITFQNKTAFEAGLYEISLVIYSGGCRDTARFVVDVEYFFIPNLLTPNGDNLNDKFMITSTDKYNIEIFNRWGNCIYKKEGYADEWDLQDVSDGIYYYNITDSRASDRQYKGWVQVVSSVQ